MAPSTRWKFWYVSCERSVMLYQWKAGFHTPIKAEIAGAELERIRQLKNGDYTPTDVVNESREEIAPLHPAFTWDDAIAAEKSRYDEARNVIRHIVVIKDGTLEPEPVRAFVSIRTEE